jgi:hypothetical protein
MAWATPKTNWATDDVVSTTDFNRIETNISHANGSISDINGMSSILSADNLPVAKKLHVVTGNNEIKFMKSTGFVAGAVIFLSFYDASSITMHHAESSPPTDYAQIHTTTSANITLSAEDMLVCNYDGTNWYVMKFHIG